MLFKQRVTRPIPRNAETFTRKGQVYAKWKDRRGKSKTAPLSDDGQRIKAEAATWSIRYRDGFGVVQTVATGCRDKTAAMTKLTELEAIADKVRAGSLNASDLEIGGHANKLLDSHIQEYLEHLRGRGVNADRIKTSESYLRSDSQGCGFKHLRDLSADKLRAWLGGQSDISAAKYNWHAGLWVAFGGWLTGKRINGKRSSMTGERRIPSNPFLGFGLKDTKSDRRREARALRLDEMQRLLAIAARRPLDDALTIRRGKNIGQRCARISDERRASLERLGFERSLIYKTAILTGLRLNELRSLRVSDLSWGDVPFLKLKPSNEKNGKGSTVPLKTDLAIELKHWVKDKTPGDLVFSVPAGLLRILNRDLVAAGIDKIDERDKRVHLHALRHSTGTHLSAAGVSPRTAQAVMRHSDIALTMGVYTDENLLATASAVELLPNLTLAIPESHSRSVTLPVTCAGVKTSVTESFSDNLKGAKQQSEGDRKRQKGRQLSCEMKSGRQDLNLRPLRPEGTGIASDLPLNTGQNEAFANRYPEGYTGLNENDNDQIEKLAEILSRLPTSELRELLEKAQKLSSSMV